MQPSVLHFISLRKLIVRKGFKLIDIFSSRPSSASIALTISLRSRPLLYRREDPDLLRLIIPYGTNHPLQAFVKATRLYSAAGLTKQVTFSDLRQTLNIIPDPFRGCNQIQISLHSRNPGIFSPKGDKSRYPSTFSLWFTDTTTTSPALLKFSPS